MFQMLMRAALIGFSLLAGIAMLGSAKTILLGIGLLTVGLSMLALPSRLRHTGTS